MQDKLAATHHYVGFPLGVAQIGIQPVHEVLDLLPVEKNDENEEEEVEHAQAWNWSDSRDVASDTKCSHAKRNQVVTQNSPKTIRHIAGCGLVKGPGTREEKCVKDGVWQHLFLCAFQTAQCYFSLRLIGCGFDPQPGHTKDFKNCPCMVFRVGLAVRSPNGSRVRLIHCPKHSLRG